MDFRTYSLRVLCPYHGMLQVLSLPAALLICLLLTAGSLQAGIFTWQDEKGRTHFGDRPPSESQASQVKLRINTYSSPEIEPFSGYNTQSPPSAVIIYSTQWCGVCKQAKRYFEQKKIPYKEYDVEKSQKGRQDFKRLQGTGVPILLVGNQRMHGFSVARFESIYQKRP